LFLRLWNSLDGRARLVRDAHRLTRAIVTRHRSHRRNHRKPTLAFGKRTQPGASPGTLTGAPDAHPTRLDLIVYDRDHIQELPDATEKQLSAAITPARIVWIDVVGLDNLELIERIGSLFNLHPLAMEDVVNTYQRAKAETFSDHLFVATRMPTGDGSTGRTEQLTLFVGKGYVLSFREHPGDWLEPVRHRLRVGRGRIRSAGADYLAYALLDAATDHYFPLLEALGERLELLEDAVTVAPARHQVAEIYAVKHELLSLRRALWPQREMLNGLIRDESSLIAPATKIYLRDSYDHVIQLMDIVETYREIASGLVEIYLSAMSTRLNEIMKVLTVIATLFMPLGFIAGIYGMNFDPAASPWNMPELGWRYGYFFALTLMVVTALGLLLYLWRNGWIGDAQGPDPEGNVRSGDPSA
jgi:magnesium transporter